MAVMKKEDLMFKSLKEELETATSFNQAICIALESFGLSAHFSIAV